MQTHVYSNMEEEISGAVFASTIFGDADKLHDVDVVRAADGASGQPTCRDDQRIRSRNRARVHYIVLDLCRWKEEAVESVVGDVG